MAKHRTPSYRLHKPTGQAVVTINGRDYYLGKHGSPTSRAEYDRLISEWLAKGRGRAVAPQGGTDISVAELAVLYLDFAGTYYRSAESGPSEEVVRIRDLLRRVKKLYGHTEARKFGPLAFKTVRQAMIDDGLCRSTINNVMGRVRRMFRWAVANEYLPPSAYQGLQAVDGLRVGRSLAKEREPVKPVAAEHLAAILPLVTKPVRAILEIQNLTGARSGEVARMRPCDIDRSGLTWIYRPAHHKTELKGKTRQIPLGPKAQEVLRPWLDVEPTDFLFSPTKAAELHFAERRANRKTPMTPSQRARRNAAHPKRPPRERYTRYSIRQAVTRACKRAGIPAWHPHQLRHSVATRIRAQYGLEAAQVVLGHASADITQVYAERDMSKAVGIMAEIG